VRLATTAVLLAALVTACRQAPQATGTATMQAYATTQDVIDAIVAPDAQAIFDAVAYENGQLTRAPRTDDQWNRLKLQALATAEAGNLLMMAPRAKDAGLWMTDAHAMSEKAAAAAAAAEAKDPDRLLLAGSELYETCTACHMTYGPKD
jgi:hypothetical protein